MFEAGDLAVANDGSGDRYCVFLRRASQADDSGLHHGWEVFSFRFAKIVFMSDNVIESHIRLWKFRVVEKGYDLDTVPIPAKVE